MAGEKNLTGTILVVGGGISGLTAAVEAGEVGYDVIVVEKRPYLGGRVAQLHQYFPKLCPPYCGLEINFRRVKDNPRIKFFTLAEVEKITGQAGNFDVTIKIKPRYVNNNCTMCGKCTEVCPQERTDEFNYGLAKTKAIYLPHEMSFPAKYVIDDTACDKCGKCVEACTYNAIDLNEQPKTVTFKVGSIIWATGWKPYDATRMDNLGFGKYQNVITNVMMERLAAINGPTKGKVLRPSDNKEIKSIAFVQCAGSRDENHLPYCSAVCCLASMKQATYIKEQYPDAKVYIFYIDLRAFGRFEDFYNRVKEYKDVNFIKGKVAKITEQPETKNLIVEAEDILSGKKTQQEVEMVVLATGMMPTTAEEKVPTDVPYDEFNFLLSDLQDNGIYAAGCAKKPMDVASCVQDATGAVLKAIQSIVRR
ncbi:MAG: CoB--CoM heterodisulfide reductase iron-sulfur subunit A family protein [Candidatus Desulfofervidaceae bacterium]|nr:CoB--CoM heterodisulfide reductase iron-sulfur subunit A family protein [Candidatus Desulfofervidaceae bacterium]